MRLKLASLLAGAIVFSTIQAASAAPPPPFNWTGFYVGGHVGLGWDDASSNITGNALIRPLITVGSIPSSLATDPRGPLGGLQFGYNYQLNKMVYGIEADFSVANIDGGGATTLPGPFLPFATYTTSVDQRLKWFSTLRARVGFLQMDRVLFYGTGGLAIGQSNYSANIHRTAFLLNFSVPASATETKTGWTIGAGAEYVLPNNWSVKAEYLYYDLGSVTLNGTQVPTIILPNAASYNFVTRGSIVRFGLNYKIQ